MYSKGKFITFFLLVLTLQANKNISTLDVLFNNKAISPRATGRTDCCDKFVG